MTPDSRNRPHQGHLEKKPSAARASYHPLGPGISRKAFPMRPICLILCVVLGGVFASLPGVDLRAGPLRGGFTSTNLPANDDESSGPVTLGFDANFFGTEYTHVFVNNNGNITFGSALADYTPFDLTSTSHQIIAPFFADVDTTLRGTVSYGTGLVDGQKAFAATWTDVSYYDANDDKANTFQVVLVDRSDVGAGNFEIEFNYEVIEWEAGDESGGVLGLGGDTARVGFSNGNGLPGTSFELDGSAIAGAFLDGGPATTSLITNSLNSSTLGRYVFFARDGQIHLTPPRDSTDPGEEPPVVPVPGAFILCGTGLASLLVYRRRRGLDRFPLHQVSAPG